MITKHNEKKIILQQYFSMQGVEPEHIVKAAALLRAGRLVSFPTETVYGLGGNALLDGAVADIYAAKVRPHFNPLIIHVATLDAAKAHVAFSPQAEILANYFWPGPLTLILPRLAHSDISLLASAGLDTLAVRVPAHPVAQDLLKEAGCPIAAPSANRSGHVSPTLASHVREEMGNKVGMVLDGGACSLGLESTVVDLTQNVPVILRPGAVTQEELQQAIGAVSVGEKGDALKSPGMLEKHYAPDKPIRLNVTDIKPGEALLAFGKPIAGAAHIQNLSRSGDLKEAAANLFRMLRELDSTQAKSIAVMPIPLDGLGVAINDRLQRAAAC
jgi:L-threonylcarbamoyladenylate synthase